jgi:hypothetical protein
VKPETEPVTPDESVLRLIWHQFLRPALEYPVKPVAFRHRPDEAGGISVFRLACLTAPTDALLAMAPEKRGGYAIAAVPVTELTAVGVTVRPDPIAAVPGHALLPELNPTTAKADPAQWKEIELRLATCAGQNILHWPAAPPT